MLLPTTDILINLLLINAYKLPVGIQGWMLRQFCGW